MKTLQEVAKAFWHNLTLEPVIFLFNFAWAIEFGARLQTNLLMWKVCHIEHGFNETVCDNLSNDQYESFQNQVQVRVNDFSMVRQFQPYLLCDQHQLSLILDFRYQTGFQGLQRWCFLCLPEVYQMTLAGNP